MEYCPHCMRPASGDICPSCGGQVHWTAPATQLPLGTLLRSASGHVFQIGAAKGQGGFGITYAALDLMNHQRVAIKEYYPSRTAVRNNLNHVIPVTGQQESFRGGLKSFLEEAQMLSAVGALPSVVSVRDYFESNGTAYLVMEYVDGIPLHEVVSRKGRMTEEELFAILPALLRDLGILHRAGVIHRDISPDNLILTTEGKLKLLDFGSARSVQADKAMTVMLKAGFSPVEQYQSKGQGPYTDVYALAGTIYYCLTGVVPPTAIDRISADELESPNRHGAKLTRQQEDALLWGMTVQPNARPQNVEAFSNALFPQGGTQGEQPVGYGYHSGGQNQTQGVPSSQSGGVPAFQTGGYGHQTHQNTNTGNKGKSNKGLIIGVAAGAVAMVLLAVVLIVTSIINNNKPTYKDRDDDNERVAAEETTSPTIQLAGETGTTEDGFTYEILGGQVNITGYVGTDTVLLFPDTVEGLSVTGIANNCLAGNTTVESVYMPIECVTIGDRAFYGCSNLRDIVTYSDSQAASSAFSGCSRLRCVITVTCSVSGWTLPSDCRIYESDMDTGAGALYYVYVTDDGVIYGVTDTDEAVIMDIPQSITTLEVPEEVYTHPVTWVWSGALDNAAAGLTVYMCPDMGFDFSLVDSANWELPGFADFAHSWAVACVLCQEMNSKRTVSDQIIPDRQVVKAAMVRVRELLESYTYTRPDGSDWGPLLDEMGAQWSHATASNMTISTANDATYDQEFDACLDALGEEFYGLRDDGEYFDTFGVAMYYVESENKIYVHAIGVVQ